MQNAPASTDGGPQESWTTCASDFAQLLQAVGKARTPEKTWRCLSHVLNKHDTPSSYEAPSDWALCERLPSLMSKCTTALLHYIHSLPSRRRCLGLLCQLTAQVYSRAASQHMAVPAVRVALAKVSVTTALLPTLRSKMDQVQPELTKSASAARNAAAAAAKVKEGVRAHKAAAAGELCADAMSHMQLASSLLQLFNTLNHIWPGDAGILASRDVLQAAPAALGLTVAVQRSLRMMQPDTIAADAAESIWSSVLETTSLIVKQLHSRLSHTQQCAAVQSLRSSSQLLHLQLQLVWLQLSSTYPAENAGCSKCSTCQSYGCQVTSADRVTAAAASSACSVDVSSSSLPRTLKQHTNGFSDSSSADAGFRWGAEGCCSRCKSQELTNDNLSIGQAWDGLVGRLWQDRIVAVASDGLALQQQHLEVLCALLSEFEQCTDVRTDWDPSGRCLITDEMIYSSLSTLTVTLLDMAKVWLQAGQQQLAAAVLGAARAAISAWRNRHEGRRTATCVDKCGTVAFELLASHNTTWLPCSKEVIVQCRDLLFVLDCTVTATAELSASSGSSDACSSINAYIVADLVGLAADAAQIEAGELYRISSSLVAGSFLFQTLLQPAVAAAEACTRQCAASAERIPAKLSAEIHGLLSAGCKIIGPTPGFSVELSWMLDGENPATATATRAAVNGPAGFNNLGQADKQVFALLLSSLKLVGINAGNSSKGDVTAAALMLDQLRRQPSTAAALPAAVPWLVVLARHVVASGELLAVQLPVFARSPTAAAAAVAVAVQDTTFGPSSAIEDLARWGKWFLEDLSVLQIAAGYLRLFVQQQQQREAAPGTAPKQHQAAAEAMWAPLASLLQLWDQGLVSELQQAQLLLQYVCGIQDGTPRSLMMLRQQMSRESHDIAAIIDATWDNSTDGHDLEVHKIMWLAVLGSTLMQQLPSKMLAAGHDLCALLPTALCCNNPVCKNAATCSELKLVAGKGHVCAGCEVPRYCGRECQAAHRQAHKKICKLIKKSRAVAAAAKAQ